MWEPNAEFLAKLVARNARFVIVGSTAVRFYLPDREVDDLDLLIEPTLMNAEIIVGTINEFGFPCACEPSALTKPKAQLSHKNYLYLDILTPDAETNFQHVLATSADAEVECQSAHIQLHIAGISTLLMMLRSSHEDKHRRDIEMLGRLGDGRS